jgi:acetyl esterase/lipase
MQGRRLKIIVLGVFFSAYVDAAEPPAAPQQPARGPGGARLLRVNVTKARHGEGARAYWLFKPDVSTPTSAPLIVFLHGWGATNPAIYGAWIDHLVRAGNIVVYPRYQADLHTPTADFLPNAIRATQDAIALLQKEPGHLRPDLSKLAVVGHSVGGLLAANVAAVADDSGLPRVSAVMSVQPGRTWNRRPLANVPLENLRRISNKPLMLVVVGDQDLLAGETDARRIYYESKQLNRADKDFVRLRSDNRGQPALTANHLTPVAFDSAYDDGEDRGLPGGRARARMRENLEPRSQEKTGSGGDDESIPLVSSAMSDRGQLQVDALDYYGLWKLFDGLCDAAFHGRNRNFALGNTLQQRFMGYWSDGKPVNQLLVTDRP